ncbi:ATP-binding protein [Sphaerisporangium sp. TRM90804]|uniref:ATP-binding protein n=1 Tax=Sphaerisporangium sp. TRM90804 TaxID=3031113 RepID=UPI00244C294A|nr:ATP-binding protein [Sphaerisporangium sp. TRM90804]MDH2425344.1 ATP-binding protein [Sphaerisporangium sp. TRM90804]
MRIGRLLGVIELAGTPESAKLARVFAGEKLGAGHPALDDVTLLVSEVVTNSLIHSDSANGGKITVALADCHDFVHVDVVDAGGDTVPHVRDDAGGEGGHGLAIVQTLAARWDVREGPGCRTVWFQVEYARASARAVPRRREPPADVVAERGA